MAEDHDSAKAKDIDSLSSVSSSITYGKTPRLKVSRYSLTGEPDDGKLSSPVLRGGEHGDVCPLTRLGGMGR